MAQDHVDVLAINDQLICACRMPTGLVIVVSIVNEIDEPRAECVEFSGRLCRDWDSIDEPVDEQFLGDEMIEWHDCSCWLLDYVYIIRCDDGVYTKS